MADHNPAVQLPNSRFIGIDIRPRSFAFLVLEGTNVLDCGSRTCNSADARDCLGQRLRRIIDTYKPETVVMRKSGARRLPYRERYSNAAWFRQVCESSQAAVIEISPDAVRNHFGMHNATTKYEIANAVASFLPDLAWKLPPQRKPWQGEHHRMAIFDAAAVVLTHLESQRSQSTSLA